ncbi:MAG: hypothetical protein HC856_10275 [Pseudanabaena sp. RU_4_16]|nr:hypothetical protein [Pseudanabaena sp. RU_4_16]
MIRFLADENLNNQIIRGVLRRNPNFEISRRIPVGLAIEEILLLNECSLEGEWEGQVRFLPLK